MARKREYDVGELEEGDSATVHVVVELSPIRKSGDIK